MKAEGDLFMKKLMATLVVVVMLVMNLTVAVSAYSDPTVMNYGYNNYNYGYNYYNCTGIRTSYSDEEYQPSSWFDTYAEQYGVIFRLIPTMPISRNDVFAPIGKGMDKAYSEVGRAFSNSYGVSFVDFTWDRSLYNVAGGLYQRGIMIGYPEDNTVRFPQNITRAEFAKVVYLTAQQNGIATYNTSNINYQFADMVDHWASQYASQCQALSLLVGKGNGYFDPEGYVTYEEYVTVMLRIAELSGRSNYSMDVEDIAYGISSTMEIDFDGYEYGTDITDLTVYGSKTVYAEVGETIELKVKATPSDIELVNDDVDWTSSKTSYLRYVDNDVDGRYATAEFKALKEGTVTVTAEAANDEDIYVEFTVVIGDDNDGDAVYVSSITVNPTEVELGVGESQSITATVYPSNASNKGIIWESHNEAVATVNQNGKITAVGVGNTTVTATAEDGSGVVATIDVTVTAGEIVPDDAIAPVVEITGADNVAVGEKVTLTVRVNEANLANFEITESDLLGLTGGASINKINKVSADTYEITLMGVEVSSLALCIDSGVAVDAVGNESAESNEVIIFVNSGEE